MVPKRMASSRCACIGSASQTINDGRLDLAAGARARVGGPPGWRHQPAASCCSSVVRRSREREARYRQDREGWRARIRQYQAARQVRPAARDGWWSLDDGDEYDDQWTSHHGRAGRSLGSVRVAHPSPMLPAITSSATYTVRTPRACARARSTHAAGPQGLALLAFSGQVPVDGL